MTPTDDAFGGYRGMWRDAEDQHQQQRAKANTLEAAARKIVEQADELDDDWKDDFPGMCDDAWHQRQQQNNEHCPVCFSTWWSLDGEAPHIDIVAEYAWPALLRRALAELP